MNNLKILNERSDSSWRNQLIHDLGRVYQHILKFILEPNKQSKSWANTIVERWNSFNSIKYNKEGKRYWNKYIENKDNRIDIILKAYNFGVKEAINETNLNKSQFQTYEIASYMGLGFDDIMNKSHLQELLIKNID